MAIPSSDKAVGQSGHTTDHNSISAELASHATLVARIPQVGLADSLVSPFYLSHRGGEIRFPTNSMEGFRASAEGGFIIDCDVRVLADDTLVVMHSPDMATETNGTGLVAEIDRETFLAARIDAPARSTRKGIPVLWDQVISEFGGRTLISVEVKDSAAVDAVVESILNRGLHRDVIFSSFNYGDIVTSSAAGICSAYIADDPAPYTWAQIAALGVEWVFVSDALLAGDITDITSVGLRVASYTVNTVADAAAEFAKGVEGVFTDDPWWLSNQYLTYDGDQFYTLTPWPGMFKRGTAPNLKLPNRLAFDPGANSGGWVDTRGLFGLRDTSSGTLKINATLSFGTYALNQTRWGGIFVGVLPTDVVYDDVSAVSGQYGYNFLVRRDGTCQIYDHPDNSTASSIEVDAGTLIADVGLTGTVAIEVEINPTDTILRDLTHSTVATVANTTNRDAGVCISLGFNGTDVYWSDIYITES